MRGQQNSLSSAGGSDEIQRLLHSHNTNDASDQEVFPITADTYVVIYSIVVLPNSSQSVRFEMPESGGNWNITNSVGILQIFDFGSEGWWIDISSADLNTQNVSGTTSGSVKFYITYKLVPK